MRFHRERFFNEPHECAALAKSFMLGLPPFDSFTLYGSDDAPARFDLYARRVPAHNDKPVAVYIRDDAGGMVRA